VQGALWVQGRACGWLAGRHGLNVGLGGVISVEFRLVLSSKPFLHTPIINRRVAECSRAQAKNRQRPTVQRAWSSKKGAR
jgi:hypothetical protein